MIHNGIIENYKELKNFLDEKGYTFYSETDTEIIVNLIEYFYLYETEQNTKESIYKAIRLLQGTYGLIILNKENPNLAYLIKQGSPLLISETENEILATSEHMMLHVNSKIGKLSTRSNFLDTLATTTLCTPYFFIIGLK